MDEKLKPCPFCGCADTKMTYIGFKAVAVVTCDACGADGPCNYDEAEAVAAWNRRAAPVVTFGMAYKMRDALDAIGVEITSDHCTIGLAAALEPDNA